MVGNIAKVPSLSPWVPFITSVAYGKSFTRRGQVLICEKAAQVALWLCGLHEGMWVKGFEKCSDLSSDFHYPIPLSASRWVGSIKTLLPKLPE